MPGPGYYLEEIQEKVIKDKGRRFPKNIRKTFMDVLAEQAKKEVRPGPGQHQAKGIFDNRQMVDYSKRLAQMQALNSKASPGDYNTIANTSTNSKPSRSYLLQQRSGDLNERNSMNLVLQDSRSEKNIHDSAIRNNESLNSHSNRGSS